jgi:hypothetical protein
MAIHPKHHSQEDTNRNPDKIPEPRQKTWQIKTDAKPSPHNRYTNSTPES